MNNLKYLLLISALLIVCSCSNDNDLYVGETELTEVENKILSQYDLYPEVDWDKFRHLFISDNSEYLSIPIGVLSAVEDHFGSLKISEVKTFNSVPGNMYKHYSVFLTNGTEAVIFQWGQLLTVATIEKEMSMDELIAGELSFSTLARLYSSFNDKIIEEIRLTDSDMFKIDFKGGERILFDKKGKENGRTTDDNGDDDGVEINASSLPQSILDYISSNYPGETITTAELYADKYEVELSNGLQLEFDLSGNFIEISGQSNIDDNNDGEGDGEDIDPGMLPQPILNYIINNYPVETITGAEVYPDGYEVTLSNGLKLEFNLQGVFIEVSGHSDDDGNDNSDDDEVINPDDLPQIILDYIFSNYPSETILRAELDANGYDIILSNGLKLEFDLNGVFIEISGGFGDNDNDDDDSEDGEDVDIASLPQSIIDYVSINFPDEFIVEAEIEDNRYEITLSNGVKLEFDLDGNFIEISGGDGDGDGTHIDPMDLPQVILDWISVNYPGVAILRAELYPDKYEVRLLNGVKIEFDLQGNVIRIDD